MNVFEHIKHYGNCEHFLGSEPDEPTSTVPGSKERLDIMAARVEASEDPFHSLDAGRYAPGDEREGCEGENQRVAGLPNFSRKF